MFGLDLVAAVLASWRLTEILTLDAITGRLRNKAKIFNCARCASVWAAAACVAALKFYPLANYPLALSWLFIERGAYSQYLTQKLQLVAQSMTQPQPVASKE